MQSRPMRRPLLMGGAAALGALALTLGGAVAANAHVSASATSAEAGAYTILTVSVPHGCDGSSTTAVSIQIPEGINAVTPTRNALYTVEKISETLDTPITDAHGNEITERIAEVIYTTTTPLSEGYRDAFELSLQLPEDAAGTTLYFPTVQTCELGETAWVEIPAEGQDAHELAAPAPALAVVSASTDDAHAASQTDSDGATVTAEEAHEDGGQGPLVITSLIVGTLGLIAGAIALVRGRKKA